MKRSWLRGVLLGASLVLLLAGGAALAQGLSISADQDCFECYGGGANGVPDDYEVELTFDGYNPQYPLLGRLMMAGTLWDQGTITVAAAPPCHAYLWVTCDDLVVRSATDCSNPTAEGASFLGSDAGTLQLPTAEYGQWVFRLWQENGNGAVVAGPVYANFTFAAVCAEEAVEFVPEPGTIALLGSGLAGLAGYAALRWRARS